MPLEWSDMLESEGEPKKPKGAVAGLGIGDFLKAEAGTAASEGAPKSEVAASRREQNRQLMPPPPQTPSRPPEALEAAPQGFQQPEWICDPPSEAFLDVIKGGRVIDRITLEKAATLFGRSPKADAVLDHPSLSCQHAAVCYHSICHIWILLDLNNAHGTTVDGHQVPKNVPIKLQEGTTLRFAASAGDYVLRLAPNAEENETLVAEQSLLEAASKEQQLCCLQKLTKRLFLEGSSSTALMLTAKADCGVGGSKPRNLPYRLKEKIRSIELAEEDSEFVTECLEQAKCVEEAQALASSSEVAMIVLTVDGCTDGALADQVDKVHADLYTALSACAKKRIGRGLFESFFEGCQPEALEDMEDTYQVARPMLLLSVAESIGAVCDAAKAALQTLEKDVATPPAV